MLDNDKFDNSLKQALINHSLLPLNQIHPGSILK